MKKVLDNKKYFSKFMDYPILHEFVQYAINDLNPVIYANEDNSVLILNSMVAYFILGEPENINPKELASIIPEGSWIITIPDTWDKTIREIYKDNVKVMDRVLFDSSSIDVEHIKSLRVDMPDDLHIVPISEKHLKDSIIVDDVTSRFFTKRDFMKYGFGYALVDDHDVVQGFSNSNFPVLGDKVELHFRIGFSDDNKYRRKGYGITLASMLIEESFKRGLDPVWDAANLKSAHIAKKLGYTEKLKWKVYVVRKNKHTED